MNNIIFLGPPGAGKGTIADILKDKLDIPHISTGDIFRENIKNNTELGAKAKEYLEAGKLVPDDITIAMVKDRLRKDDCQNGFLLDGFPRTIPQADALKNDGVKIDHVLNFVVSKELIIKRITNRRTCRKCGTIFNIITVPPKQEGICDKCGGELYQREDETPEVIEQRLKTYHEQTSPLIEYYHNEGLLKDIDASKTPQEIADECLTVLAHGAE